ncbi:hypothetical protein [Thiocapsa sp.]|uniref:hypothetical protein n=1 Tax=Thiocapsa sp. TaxID=2024551 RepID=UPI0025EDCF0C|nr:hypothetical protein [Thiocapsa sp.]
MVDHQSSTMTSDRTRPGRIVVSVRDGDTPAFNVPVGVYQGKQDCVCTDGLENGSALDAGQWTPVATGTTGDDGRIQFDRVPAAAYLILANVPSRTNRTCVRVEPGCTADACIDLGLHVEYCIRVLTTDCKERDCGRPRVNDRVQITADFAERTDAGFAIRVLDRNFRTQPDRPTVSEGVLRRAGLQELVMEFLLPFHDVAEELGLDPMQPSSAVVTGAPTAFEASAPADSPAVSRAGGPSGPGRLRSNMTIDADEEATLPLSGKLTVSHQRRIAEPDGTMSFFVRLLDASRSIEFGRYADFIDSVFECTVPANQPNGLTDECRANAIGNKFTRLTKELTDHGVGAYELLKTATESFLLFRCCAQSISRSNDWPLGYQTNPQLGDYKAYSSDDWRTYFEDYLKDQLGTPKLPYIQRVIATAFPQYGITEKLLDQRFCADVLLRSRVENPCFMELIWNYWHEEAMLVQSMNAVSRRFQNLHSPGRRDPLAHMEIDPLRPLNNILWGYVEDERGRLSIKRRGYEYQHQYGLNLYGKAVADLRPADNRSKFIEAFHNLLNRCADYYRSKQDTTVDPDGYPILHAIQELNLILAQGAHNQFGDLAWTSRVEMLMQEWIMARPEMRDFLQSRAMVPYKEPWMPQVDTMKTLQGWSDVVVTHFRDLGVFGEQILLTIRWYNWYDVTSEEEAKGWADLLRAQIQTYIHAYRAVTGVDLSSMDRVDYIMPSVHLRKRLAMQQRAR